MRFQSRIATTLFDRGRPTLAALLIHISEDGVGPVSPASLERAIGWVCYLESHARCIYAMVSRLDVAAAGRLGDKLLSRELKEGFSRREVYRPQWAGLTTREEALAAVQVLEDHDWLVVTKEHTAGAPRTCHWVNPRIYTTIRKQTDKTDRRPRE